MLPLCVLVCGVHALARVCMLFSVQNVECSEECVSALCVVCGVSLCVWCACLYVRGVCVMRGYVFVVCLYMHYLRSVCLCVCVCVFVCRVYDVCGKDNVCLCALFNVNNSRIFSQVTD